MLSQELINKIVEGNDIVEVIKQSVKLDKRGVNYIGCCPFHSEKTPSFTVSPAKQIYKCFGCGVSGNVVKFVMELEKQSWFETMKELAKRAQVELPAADLTPEQKQANDKREALFIANRFAADTWRANFEASPGRAYLKERGFDEADFEKFGIGYAPESWDFMKEQARKAGHTENLMVEASLLSRNENGKVYDRFRDRVMFPIHNLYGKVAGFTGRIIQPDPDKKLSKYMNTTENAVYQKRDLLYGLFQAKTAIAREGRCNVVEGNTDVMRWHQRGIENTVGTCGTALTKEHARLLHRFTQNVNIVFDGDAAGLKAAIKGIDILLAEGLNVYVTVMPQGQDPDSFAQDKKRDELYAWIEVNEKDFVLFRSQIGLKDMQEKPAEKARILNEIRETINLIPDAVTREIYVEEVAKIFNVETKVIRKGLTDAPGAEILFGVEACAEAIKAADEVYLYATPEEAMEAIAEEQRENVVALNGFPLKPQHIGAIEVLTKNLVFADMIEMKIDLFDEPESIRDMKRLAERGFRISVTKPEGWSCDTNTLSFTEIYFDILRLSMDQFDTESKKQAIELAAEFLAKQDRTTVSIKTGEVAKGFSLNKAAFEQVLKPYLNKQRSKATLHHEAIVVDEQNFVFDDIDKLPEYVDRNFLNKYRHFPVQNSKGQKIFYMFQGDNGQLFRVCNFYIEPQFQVRSDDPNKNKRIVKLNHSELGTSKYVEILSDQMVEFGPLKKFLWRQGPYTLRNCKPQHLDMILDSIALEFPVTDELDVYGQQDEGFYAWCNATLQGDRIEYMDELGLIKVGDETYYSPSVSCIYRDIRKSNDKYANDRYFILRENPNINLRTWAELMLRVYKHNDNGYWCVIITILAAFRSNIFELNRLFTTLFLYGPTGCGKSEMAQSIRAVYMHPEAPMFNLNSGTDAAFFTMLERYCDAVIIMEEYNDMQISDAKFQGLKAAVYDGEGKTKRKDASSKDLDQSKVNAVPILLGQEAPERDDASLANRTVMLQVKKVEYWSDEETKDFDNLKKLEKIGLSNVLIEILKQRPIVKKHFQKKLEEVRKELRDDMRANGQIFETRILSTIALFATMVKLIDENISDFKLPFSYDEFYPIARRKLVEQSESIQKTNRLAAFFDTILLLSEDDGPRGLIRGKEYKIEAHDSIVVGRTGKEELRNFEGNKANLLFLRLDMIHNKYKATVGEKEHLKINNLMTYLKDHPAYVGQIKMTDFRWKVEIRTDDGMGAGKVISQMREEKKRTSATVMNYDLLREVIDLGDPEEWVYRQNPPSPPDEGRTDDDPAVAAAKSDAEDRDLPF